MQKHEDNRSAIWGGVTIGLFAGIILGFIKHAFFPVFIYCVLIGVGLGTLAQVLGWVSDNMSRK